MILDALLFLLTIFFALNVLFTVFSDENDEKILIIINDSTKKIFPGKFPSLTKTEEEYNDYYSGFDQNILSNMELPPVYDLEEVNNCFSLLNEFNSCFISENEINYNCQKSFGNRLYEIEKCDSIISSVASMDIKDEFKKLFINNEDNDIDIFKEINEYEKTNIGDIYEEEKKEDEEKKKKKEQMFEDIINESFIIKNDKDCIEYELSEEDNNIIKCVKYE